MFFSASQSALAEARAGVPWCAWLPVTLLVGLPSVSLFAANLWCMRHPAGYDAADSTPPPQDGARRRPLARRWLALRALSDAVAVVEQLWMALYVHGLVGGLLVKPLVRIHEMGLDIPAFTVLQVYQQQVSVRVGALRLSEHLGGPP